MAFDYINEAFKKLDILEEETFRSSIEGINKLTDFIDEDDNIEDTVRVLDPEAKDTDELSDSYVGKVIINCNVCHSHIFENKDEIIINDEGTVNIDMQCPYCGESEGFLIIGEIAPYADEHPENDTEEYSAEDEPSEDTTSKTDDDSSDTNLEEDLSNKEKLKRAYPELNFDNSVTESKDDSNVSVKMSRASARANNVNSISEDFKEVSITTEDQHMEMTSDENGKVTVTTEPISTEPTSEETIVPISAETEEEILSNNSDIVENPTEDSTEDPTEDTVIDEIDLSFDEADDEGMDELGESYFKRVYENVQSFKTTDIMSNDSHMIVEGLITFDSGVQKKTGFVFEAKDVNSRGQLRFTGKNKQIAESCDAFSLVGRIDNKKLFVESLKYNYSVDDNNVRGIVRRK